MILALFAVAPVVCSCLLSLLYTLYLFMAYEESGVHHAQEFENRFWTIFALLFSTALFFARDSPVAFGRVNPSLGFFGVLVSSYAMHLWDRYMHRVAISKQTNLRRSMASLSRDLGGSVDDQLGKINESLRDIDQLLIPSTINNFINQRFVFRKEKDIISVFSECDAVALNHLIGHVKLGLLIYKIKDHRNFAGQHRTELIQLLAVERLPALTVMSRVIVMHALQILKLRANPRAEYWVRNIILNTHGDDLSQIKTLTDAKGDYFCMNKLIYDDIKSETVRQDILSHIRREAAVQQAHMQMQTKRAQKMQHLAWRKILSDVDDTLFCSGGHYPAGMDKRYAKKVVYPGVLAFYRELDLGTTGPEEWPDNRVGNLVFLSARPHLYKDMSEKSNFAKFEKLRVLGDDGRKGMHTVPSLLAGDLSSGSQFMATNDCEPLSKKKFDNFKRYVSIYPEFQHVFVCDNGQGDVRAGEMMFDSFPYEFETMYVHIVQDVTKTYGYAPDRWREKEFTPCFFRTYPEAALHAASRKPPKIRVTGLQRVCHDAVKDFSLISSKQWHSQKQKAERRAELNQGLWKSNVFLESRGLAPVELVQAERMWQDGDEVKTPYGSGIIKAFNPEFDMYDVQLDWRPLDVQVDEQLLNVKKEAIRPKANSTVERRASAPLETVLESDEVTEDVIEELPSAKDHVLNRTESMPTAAAAPDPAGSRSTSETSTLEGASEVPLSPGEVETPVVLSDLQSVVSVPEKNSMSETSSVSSVTSDVDANPQDGKTTKHRDAMIVCAQISGRFITKYTPPHLPKINKKTSPLFSFWTDSPEVPKGPWFKEGEECTTPYGPATVVEHRREQKIVVVDFIGWKAIGYLAENGVKIMSKGILSSLFRRQSNLPEVAPTPKPLEFPFAQGTDIKTPFGTAIVTRPLPIKDAKLAGKKDSTPAAEQSKLTAAESPCQTIGLSLTSWTLANNSHPKLYCTVETARIWKDTKSTGAKSSGDGLLSAFGTLVSSTFDFAGRFSVQKPPKDEKRAPKFTRHYRDSAAVSTAFGAGVVLGFRENDGFYKLSLVGWTLANGAHPIAYLHEVDVNYRIAKGCQEGYPVLTSLGLTGKLESVEPATGKFLGFTK